MKQPTQNEWKYILKIMKTYRRTSGWIAWIEQDNGNELLKFFDGELINRQCAYITIDDVRHVLGF